MAGDEHEGSADEESVPSIDVHQPGDPATAGLGPRPVEGDPPDAVGGEDDRSGGPEERAPEPPTEARDT